MSFVTVGQENSEAVRIYYEDHGSGDPVILVHGYLLDGHSWEKQEAALLTAEYRVITYDRRGFGNSSRPSVGYDYDTLAADLDTLLCQLDLDDVTLVGYCTGTGEVIRYLAAYGADRVRAAALIAPLPPYLLRTPDNPHGIDRGVVDGFQAEIADDRPAAAKAFLDKAYNIDLLGGSHVSDQAWQNSFHAALRASAIAARGCISAALEDFRGDLQRIDIPVLILQGNHDRILPPEATGDRLPAFIQNIRHIVIDGGPHAIIWTHADQVNEALLGFIRLARTGGI
jgi:non-heme chloroperoxidase